ncbi:MAG: PorP/SprF family type IX secretion system membrane protein, partial [Bacteroidetes bacterium]|nr:PorP/SprF family type IX secretion system membrane protein [Bacteroidota bacterium]
MKRNLLYIFLLLASVLKGQDIHFSQFYLAPTFLNPASTGAMENTHRVSMLYKDQWRSVTTPYKTSSFSYDAKIGGKDRRNKDFIGLGIAAFTDKAGDSQMGISQVVAGFSYHKKLGREHRFSFGMQGGLRQYSISFNNAQWGTQFNGADFDPSMGSMEYFNNQTNTVSQANAGVQYQFKKEDYNIIIGLATHHLTRQENSFSGTFFIREQVKTVAQASLEPPPFQSNIHFVPHLLFIRQGQSFEAIAGSLVKFKTKEASR